MVKDRLQEFQDRAQQYDDGESISLINYFAIIDMEGTFMGDFFDQLSTLRSTIDKIIEFVDQVEHLQRMMLSAQPIPRTKERLEKTMGEIKQLGNYIRVILKKMKQIQDVQNTSQRKNVRQRIIDSQIDACTKCFCTTMNRYYASVLSYREKCKVRLARQLQIANITRDDDQIEEILQQGRLSLSAEIIIETQDGREMLAEMELRQRDLVELENRSQLLHDMFYDLANLVYLQDYQTSSMYNAIASTKDDIDQSNKITYARKVSDCFYFKFSRKRFASSLVSLLSRLFSPCL